MEKSTILVIIMAAGIIGAMTFAASQKLDTSGIIDLNACDAKYKTVLPPIAAKSSTICDQLCASHCSMLNMRYSCTRYFKSGETITDEYYLKNLPEKARSKGVKSLQPICICGCE